MVIPQCRWLNSYFLIVRSPICIFFPWDAFNVGVEGQSSFSLVGTGLSSPICLGADSFTSDSSGWTLCWWQPYFCLVCANSNDQLLNSCVKAECADLKNFLSQNWMMQKLSWSSKARICCRCFLYWPHDSQICAGPSPYSSWAPPQVRLHWSHEPILIRWEDEDWYGANEASQTGTALPASRKDRSVLKSHKKYW